MQYLPETLESSRSHSHPFLITSHLGTFLYVQYNRGSARNTRGLPAILSHQPEKSPPCSAPTAFSYIPRLPLTSVWCQRFGVCSVKWKIPVLLGLCSQPLCQEGGPEALRGHATCQDQQHCSFCTCVLRGCFYQQAVSKRKAFMSKPMHLSNLTFCLWGGNNSKRC